MLPAYFQESFPRLALTFDVVPSPSLLRWLSIYTLHLLSSEHIRRYFLLLQKALFPACVYPMDGHICCRLRSMLSRAARTPGPVITCTRRCGYVSTFLYFWCVWLRTILLLGHRRWIAVSCRSGAEKKSPVIFLVFRGLVGVGPASWTSILPLQLVLMASSYNIPPEDLNSYTCHGEARCYRLVRRRASIFLTDSIAIKLIICGCLFSCCPLSWVSVSCHFCGLRPTNRSDP